MTLFGPLLPSPLITHFALFVYALLCLSISGLFDLFISGCSFFLCASLACTALSCMAGTLPRAFYQGVPNDCKKFALKRLSAHGAGFQYFSPVFFPSRISRKRNLPDVSYTVFPLKRCMPAPALAKTDGIHTP